MSEPAIIPKIIYGTAWKKNQTSEFVVGAVKAGFRAIDTACQPKHYQEQGVGRALELLKACDISRQDLFIQTKFTPFAGQDPSQIPYDPALSLGKQVLQSFAVSQRNLGTEVVDSLLLHSPLSDWKEFLEVWRAMESIHEAKGARFLGISNCYDLNQLKTLHRQALVKPAFLQNRFYAETAYDSQIRAWCLDKGIVYQSFWTLTGNPDVLRSSEITEIAAFHKKTPAQIFFRFVTQLGIVPLTGTRSEIHMREDLEIFDFDLSQDHQRKLESILQNGN
ncbi:unnamed protein product [Sphagnum tenellum]